MVEARNGRAFVHTKLPELFKELSKKGLAGRKEVEAIIEKVVADARMEDRLSAMRGNLEMLQKSGLERTKMWRGKAESFRADALELMLELQGKVVSFLGVATREQVEELQKELERLAKRVGKGQKTRPAKKIEP
jgi:hypothetical protein